MHPRRDSLTVLPGSGLWNSRGERGTVRPGCSEDSGPPSPGLSAYYRSSRRGTADRECDTFRRAPDVYREQFPRTYCRPYLTSHREVAFAIYFLISLMIRSEHLLFSFDCCIMDRSNSR